VQISSPPKNQEWIDSVDTSALTRSLARGLMIPQAEADGP
jgi:hypothetical protein